LAGNVTTIDNASFASYDDFNKISSLAGSGASVSYNGDGDTDLVSLKTAPI